MVGISKLSILTMTVMAIFAGKILSVNPFVNLSYCGVFSTDAMCFAKLADMNEASLSKEELIGKINPEAHTDFRIIPAYMASRSDMYLRSEALDSLIAMRNAAQAEGIKIRVISAFRSFDHQKKIWEDKWYGRGTRHRHYSQISNKVTRSKAILTYSAMPGTSRHHWGTDIDINSLSNAYFETGEGRKLYDWMLQNAHKFGFCQPYTEKGFKRTTGHESEKWHWSFKPMAEKILNQYIEQIDYESINGFAGAEKANELNVIEEYVLGISTDCL